jgi:hypothetical protein
VHDGVCIRAGTNADIITLDRADEGFGHSIALWTFDRRGSRFEADVASEAACLAGEVTAAIVDSHSMGARQAIAGAEAMLDGASIKSRTSSR